MSVDQRFAMRRFVCNVGCLLTAIFCFFVRDGSLFAADGYASVESCLNELAGDPILAERPSGEATLPIQLHPDNPRYFLWRGKPAVLITSGEHYGAVMNLDFDYERLNTKTATVDKVETLDHGGGARVLVSPSYSDDIALRVNRIK